MTNTAANRTATALRYRKQAVDAFNQAQDQYEIALLDHITARILEVHPETTHLTFAHFTLDRLIKLHGLWTTYPRGTEELLLDVREEADTGTLDLAEISDDLTDALTGLRSAAWSAVRPNPRSDGRWVLDLPPANRVARIAELVHVHYPDTGLLTVDFVGDTCRVLNVASGGVTELSRAVTELTTADDEPSLWPEETERQITALTLQIRALPHLRAQYLIRVGGPAEHRAFLLLPQAETGEE